MSTSVIYIIIFMLISYAGIFIFIRMRKKNQANLLKDVDISSEMNNASKYKNEYLNKELPHIVKQMDGKPIDAFNFANNEYSIKDSMKDDFKDRLKGLATLGTVKFTTIQTPKYLILSDDSLHFIDTDTDGEISNHLVFNHFRLINSSIKEIEKEGMVLASANQKGKNIKAYKLSLATDDKPLELIILSALVFTYDNTVTNYLSINTNKVLKEVVIGNDFIKKIGEKYPNLKVAV